MCGKHKKFHFNQEIHFDGNYENMEWKNLLIEFE